MLELRDCADDIAALDNRMQKIYRKLDEIEEAKHGTNKDKKEK